MTIVATRGIKNWITMNGTQEKTRSEQKQIQYFKESIECKK